MIADVLGLVGAYLGIGWVVRVRSVAQLRKVNPTLWTDRKWMRRQGPVHLARARMWWVWPLALAKGTDFELKRYESEIAAATLEELQAERDKLDARMSRERTREQERERINRASEDAWMVKYNAKRREAGLGPSRLTNMEDM